MSEHESSTGEEVQNVAGGFTPGQQAGLATAAAATTGALLAVFGLALDVESGQVMVLVGLLGLVTVTGLVYGFFRAMLTTAAEHEGDPLAAVTYPLFPALFMLLAVTVAVAIGVFLGQAG